MTNPLCLTSLAVFVFCCSSINCHLLLIMTPFFFSENRSMVFFAAVAGMFAAISGVLGKLSVTPDLELPWLLRMIFFALNPYCTVQMWRYYLKALSVAPTPKCQIINAGTNFAVSAILGIVIFSETTNAMWMCGAALVAIGLAVIATNDDADKTIGPAAAKAA